MSSERRICKLSFKNSEPRSSRWGKAGSVLSWAHRDAASIPSLAQRVKDLSSPPLQLGSDAWPRSSICYGVAKKEKNILSIIMEEIRKLSKMPFELYFAPPVTGQNIAGDQADTQGLGSSLLVQGREIRTFGQIHLLSLSLFFFFLFRATPAAYGSSQARGRMGAAAASHCHSHRNTGSLTH